MRTRHQIEETTQNKTETSSGAVQQQVHVQASILETLLDIRELLIELNKNNV